MINIYKIPYVQMLKNRFAAIFTFSGLALIFFLPVIESFNRDFSYSLLLFSSLLIGVPYFLKKQIIFDLLDVLFLIMLISFCISNINSLIAVRSYTEFIRYTAYFLIFVGLRKNLYRSQVNKFFILMVIVNSVILSCLAIIYMIKGVYLPESPINGMNLFYPVFGHNSLANILVFSIPISINLMSIVKSKYIKSVLLIMSIFFLFNLVLTFSRTGMLSLTVTLIIFLLFKKKYLEIKSWTVTVIILETVTILFLLSSFIYSNFLIKGNNKNMVIHGFYKPMSGEFRLTYIRQAVSGFVSSPIFGTGLDTFRQISFENRGRNEYSMSYYTHNHYLELFTETGIAGGIIFILLIFFTSFFIYKNLTKNKESFLGNGIYLGLIASSLQSILDYNWQYYSVFLIYWLGSAILLNNTQTYWNLTTKSKIYYIFIFAVIIFFSLQIYFSTTPFYRRIMILT